LMCADLVLRFSGEAFESVARRGLQYGASIATNAYYLTPALFEQLLDVGVVSYQVTLDGDRTLHDQQRVTVAGAPTFDRVAEHLRGMAAVRSPFNCLVRCNARPEDMDRVLALFDEDTLKPLRDDRRFVVDLQAIWSSDRQGVDAAPQKEACGAKAGQNLDIFLYNRELETRGYRTMAYSRRSSELTTSCYAGKPNWFVVGPDLALYKCTVVFEREENRVGHVNPDGTLTLDQAKNELWTGSNALTDISCGTCHLRVPCAGLACPLTRFSKGHKSCPDSKTIDRLRAWSKNRPTGAEHRSPRTER
jgi:uncharacterized protein